MAREKLSEMEKEKMDEVQEMMVKRGEKPRKLFQKRVQEKLGSAHSFLFGSISANLLLEPL